jgi:hypothetical protein
MELEELFPYLADSGYQVTSPRDDLYNCIAWAAGDTTDWWWPGANPDLEYWPPGIPRAVSLAAFEAVFATLGYVVCAAADLEPGIEKITLYANAVGKPTHGARQLTNGRWTSKLGKREDIEHALHDLEGELYGTVVRIMKRPRPLSQGASD